MMVMADFIIFCIRQKKMAKFESQIFKIDCYKNCIRYKKFTCWDILQSLYGNLYDIYTNKRNDADFDQYEPFDLRTSKKDCFGEFGMVVVQKNLEEIKRVINFYLQSSPIKKIAVLFRLQGKEKETFQGETSEHEFIQLLIKEKIRYNVVYLITGENDKDEIL
jgi:hypothetical protein